MIPYLAEKIGFDSETEKNASILFYTFITKFVNSAILPPLTSLDLRYYPFINILPIHGAYSDFNTQWYDRIGKSMILTMVLMVINP